VAGVCRRRTVGTCSKNSLSLSLYKISSSDVWIVFRAVFPEATEESYAEQLAAKRGRVDTLFKDMSIPDIEVHRSKSEHYRLR